MFPVERETKGTGRATVRINLRSPESSLIFFLRDNKMLRDRLEKVFSRFISARLLAYLLYSARIRACSRYRPDLCAYYCYVAPHPRLKFVSRMFSTRLENFDDFPVDNSYNFNENEREI